MDKISRIGSWLYNSLDLEAAFPATEYLKRAGYILAALAVLVTVMWHVNEKGGSMLWMIPAFLLVVVAAANGVWPLRNAAQSFGIGTGGGDDISTMIALPFVFVFAVIIPCLLALLSPLLLIWNLIQSARVALR